MSATQPLPDNPAQGRAYLWAGIAVCLLAVPLIALQFRVLHSLFVPWYSPILATLGAVLILVSLMGRPTIFRGVVLVVIAAFAGLQWFFFVSLMKLPEYTGPVKTGKHLPAFTSTSADGSPFTEESLRDKSRRALVFFRGRW